MPAKSKQRPATLAPAARARKAPATPMKRGPMKDGPAKAGPVKAESVKTELVKTGALKIGKRLEATAREVKDADEFVEHVAGLANRYRREHALVSGDAQAELRQALRTFHKHASALTEWLQQANGGKPSAIERKAFDALGTKLYGSPVLARPQSVQTLEWLTRASQAADETVAGMKRAGEDHAALRIAAEGLRATFEHHKLKVTLIAGEQPSDAVRLLCAIARDAGDDSVEPSLAKIALRDANRRPEAHAA
jgi:hypothetical protein